MALTYFHMSPSALSSGTILECRGFPFIAPELETLLADAMPEDALPRSSSVFMSLSEEACKNGLKYDEGYLHTVQPVEPVYQRDLKWLRELELRHFLRTRELSELKRAAVTLLLNKKHASLSDREIALRYWRGESTDNADWEFVAVSAEITACLSESPVRIRGGA